MLLQIGEGEYAIYGGGLSTLLLLLLLSLLLLQLHFNNVKKCTCLAMCLQYISSAPNNSLLCMCIKLCPHPQQYVW